MELFTESMGASIYMASSHDINYPLSNLLEEGNNDFNEDNTNKKVYVTTGYFPQEFILQLGERSTIHSIKTVTCNCKTLIVERCDKPVPSVFHKILDIDLDEMDGNLQIETNQLPPNAAYFLRFRILSGWREFVSVHNVSIIGHPKDKYGGEAK